MEEIGNQGDCNGITRNRPKLKRIRIRKLLRKKKVSNSVMEQVFYYYFNNLGMDPVFHHDTPDRVCLR